MKVIVVTGSRDFTDEDQIFRMLDEEDPDLVLHGNARGADRIADIGCRRRGIPVQSFPAAWKTHDPEWCRCRDPKAVSYCKAAGSRRNWEMAVAAKGYGELDGFEVRVHAYPLTGPGTRNMIESCRQLGLEVVVHEDQIAALESTLPSALGDVSPQ